MDDISEQRETFFANSVTLLFPQIFLTAYSSRKLGVSCKMMIYLYTFLLSFVEFLSFKSENATLLEGFALTAGEFLTCENNERSSYLPESRYRYFQSFQPPQLV